MAESAPVELLDLDTVGEAQRRDAGGEAGDRRVHLYSGEEHQLVNPLCLSGVVPGRNQGYDVVLVFEEERSLHKFVVLVNLYIR